MRRSKNGRRDAEERHLVLQRSAFELDARWGDEGPATGYLGKRVGNIQIPSDIIVQNTHYHSSFNAPVHLEVLRSLVESPSCPRTVLSLTGHGILAMVSDPKASLYESKVPNSSFKTATLRSIASKALGLPDTGESFAQRLLTCPDGS